MATNSKLALRHLPSACSESKLCGTQTEMIPKQNQASFSHTRQAVTIGVHSTHSQKQIQFTKGSKKHFMWSMSPGNTLFCYVVPIVLL